MFNKLKPKNKGKPPKPTDPLRHSCPSNFDYDGKSLIKSMITMKCWDLLAKLINENPGMAKIQIDVIDGGKQRERIPIHEVCRLKPPLNLVQALEAAYPNSLKLRDTMNGSLPIHFAARFGASEEVIKYLLFKNPESAFVEDKYCCTPLTCARRGSYRHKEEIVEILEGYTSKKDRDVELVTIVANGA